MVHVTRYKRNRCFMFGMTKNKRTSPDLNYEESVTRNQVPVSSKWFSSIFN